eukprot:1142491-Pelagomonas_calceolata.AAC.6
MVLKVPNWGTWACTDGNCHIQNGKQEIGSGVLCPLTDSNNFVEPNGAGIQFPSIAAAILNPRHPGIETGFKKFEKLPSDQQYTPKNIVQANNPSCRLPHLAQTWSEKSGIGKSGHTQMVAAKYISEDK